MDGYFKDLQKQVAAINKMLEPTRHVAEQVAQQLEPVQRVLQQQNYQAAFKQMKAISDSVNSIKQQLHSQPISKFLESYNETSKLINNYDDYFVIEDKEQLEEIEIAKEEVGDMPDLESAAKTLSPELEEQLKLIMADVVEEALTRKEVSKGKETKASLPAKVATGLTLFLKIPEIPEAVEKYYIMIKAITGMF